MSVQSETGRAAAAWTSLADWLAEYAPASYASLLPPASEDAITAAEARLMQAQGFGFPHELKALWRVCGGVQKVDVPGNEDGAVWAGSFLPGGIFLAPGPSLWQRLRHDPGAADPWGGAEFVSFLDAEEPSGAGEHGMYVSYPDDPTLRGVGAWSAMTGPDLSPPAWPSIAAYVDAVCALLRADTGQLHPDAGQQPVLALGCLAWIDPDDGLEVPWRPLHP